MSAFHVYVEAPVDRSPEGIERLAVAISQKYGLPVPDLIKRMTAGRFRVKANIDAATADAYARALEGVGARVKVEEAFPTQPVPLLAAEPAPPPRPTPPPDAPPRTKASTLPGEKPSRGGYYSVSPPPSSSRTVAGARSKAPTSAPGATTSSGPPREAHERSQLMPPRAKAPSVSPAPAPTAHAETPGIPSAAAAFAPPAADDPFGDLELSLPSSGSSNARPSSSSLPIAKPANSARPGASVLPPPTTPRPTTSSLPPATASRPATSSLSPATERPPSSAPTPPAFQSGLSAAYSQQVPVASDLGALGSDAISLDGDDPAGPDVSFDAPSPGMPASIGPAPEPASPVKFVTKPAAPAGGFDLFAPPDAEEAEQVVNLAPQVEGPRLPSTPALRKTPVSQGAVMGGVAVPEMPRSRMVAGIFLAILIGFLPAHLFASMRESSAFKQIEDQIIATQAAANTPEMYATLDSFRDAQLARKESERRSIALTSMLIWAVTAAGLGYVWFKRIPWDRMPRA